MHNLIQKIKILVAALLLTISSCNSQDKPQSPYRLIGNCEGCEAIFEYGDRSLSATDTLPDFSDPGPKLKITGTVFLPDGRTPAANVILYIYHTDQNGVYATRGDESGWARRHGYIRGWIKTADDGCYTFYTLRPGVYPNRSQPAHIHPVILEPGGKYYWLGSYFFEDDSLLSEQERAPHEPRAGSPGVMKLIMHDGLWVGRRDFVLGKNIPGYGN